MWLKDTDSSTTHWIWRFATLCMRDDLGIDKHGKLKRCLNSGWCGRFFHSLLIKQVLHIYFGSTRLPSSVTWERERLETGITIIKYVNIHITHNIIFYTKYTNLITIVMLLVVVTVVMEWKKCGWLVVVYMMGVWEGERGVWFGVCMWLEWWWNKLGNMVPWDDTLGQSQIITLHYTKRVMTRKWLTFKWGWWLYGVKNFLHCTTTTIHTTI